MTIILEYFLNSFNNSINLFYFFILMFMGELVKMIPIIKQDPIARKYYLFINNKHICYFDFKWIILDLGILLGGIFYFFESGGLSFKESGNILLKIVLTFSITMTLYDLLFQLIIVKIKVIISNLIKATIKPVVIDLNGFTGGASQEEVIPEEIKN